MMIDTHKNEINFKNNYNAQLDYGGLPPRDTSKSVLIEGVGNVRAGGDRGPSSVSCWSAKPEAASHASTAETVCTYDDSLGDSNHSFPETGEVSRSSVLVSTMWSASTNVELTLIEESQPKICKVMEHSIGLQAGSLEMIDNNVDTDDDATVDSHGSGSFHQPCTKDKHVSFSNIDLDSSSASLSGENGFEESPTGVDEIIFFQDQTQKTMDNVGRHDHKSFIVTADRASLDKKLLPLSPLNVSTVSASTV